MVALTGFAGGPPLPPPGRAASVAREIEAAFRSLVGPGAGGLPAGWHRLLAERAALTGARRSAPFSPGGACRAVATTDGWVAVNLARDTDVEALPALTGRARPPEEAAWAFVDRELARMTSAEVAAGAALLGLPIAAIPLAGSIRRSRPVHLVEVASGEGARAGSEPPLVADLSALWAGPLAASLLVAAGWRSVKFETGARLDGARRGNAAFYDVLHAGQDSVVADPRTAGGRRFLERLLDKADVVVEASRPRALQAWGIDRLKICARSPKTWISITAHGPSAPDRVGFGDDVAMAGGLYVTSPGDGRPIPVGDAIADPLAGMRAALEALASHRRGGSRLIHVSMRDLVAETIPGAPPWDLQSAAPIEPPSALRAAAGPAAAPGRDTAAWMSRLGC